MAVHRITFRFRLFNQSWTETYYTSYSGTPEQVCYAFDDAKTIRNGIMGGRSPKTMILSIEARDVTNARLAHVRKLNQVRAAGSPVSNTVDVAAVSARYKFTAANGASRYAWIRGLPDGWTLRDFDTGLAAPSVQLIAFLDSWRDILKGGQVTSGYSGPWNLQIRSLTPDPLQTNTPLVTGMAAVVGQPSRTNVTLAAPLAPLPREVRFLGNSRPNALGGLQGAFRVLAAVGNVVTIGYRLRSDLVGGLPQGLRMAPVIWRYDDITGGSFQDLSTHDTGDPTGRRRGRRLAGQSRQ